MPPCSFGLNCTLTSSPTGSSTQKMLDLLLDAVGKQGVQTSFERVVDHDVKAGGRVDEAMAMPGRRCASGCWTRTSWCLPRRSGWASHPASPSVLERMDASCDERFIA